MLTKLVPNLLFRFDTQYGNRPATGPQPPNQPFNFVRVEDRRFKLRHPVSVGGQSVSPTAAGNHINPERNFKWLPWILGKVAYVPLRTTTVVTGEMSGCWLIIFRLNATGQVCFGHIGTFQDSSHSDTKEAIQAWKIAVRSGQITPIRAFNPITVGPNTPKTFAAATAAQELYTIGLDRVMAPPGFPGAMPYKVIHVTHAAGVGPATPY